MRDFVFSIVVGFVGVCVMLGVYDGATRARADEDISREGLLLARICAHEAGWDAHETGDCAAIHEVLWRGAMRHNLSYRAYAYAYSGRALRGETSRAYFAELDADGSEPPSWPRYVTRRREDGAVSVLPGPSWSSYRYRWLDLLAYAEAIVHDGPDASSPCAEPVHDWGGVVDMERAERIGLVVVDCGETRNLFYRRPWLSD